MIKRTLKPSDYFLIAANLWPVVGAFVWGWSATEIFIVYCLETVIIGIFNLLKMGVITLWKKTDTWYNGQSRMQVTGLFFMFFFLVHYGMFVAIQTGLFFAASGIGKTFHTGFFDFFLHWPQYLSSESYSVLLGFVISYGFKFLWDFVGKQEYKEISLMRQMFQPYLRIFIQQVTVILGSMFLQFGSGKIFILIFALVKIVFEVLLDFEKIMNQRIKTAEEEMAKKNTNNQQ